MRRVILLLLAAAFAGGAPAGYATYQNTRFGFSVEYPKAVLLPQGEADNGDGQQFESRDKRFRLAVWAGFNVLEKSVAEVCKDGIRAEKSGTRVTYQVVKSDWYVYSGIAGEDIVYQKGILRGDTFTTLRLQYPMAEKEKWDADVKRIVASLSATSPEAVSPGKEGY